MKYVLVNHNFKPSWLPKYSDDYLIFDRSDSREYLAAFPAEKVVVTENRGNVDYDKLMYLVENDDSLPDVFVWGKTNLFKYITEPEFVGLKERTAFTPLIRQDHRTYNDRLGLVNYYDQFGIYYERNDSWFLNAFPSKFRSFSEWAAFINIPSPAYIPFAPGGNYILTRETVHRYSRDLYQKMADTLPYVTLPGEAQLCERSYFLLWK